MLVGDGTKDAATLVLEFSVNVHGLVVPKLAQTPAPQPPNAEFPVPVAASEIGVPAAYDVEQLPDVALPDTEQLIDIPSAIVPVPEPRPETDRV